MKWRMIAVMCIVFALSEAADAQPPRLGQPPRPAFSPYLNLVRDNNPPVLNYYGLVRPEIQARQAIIGLQGSVSANQQAISGLQQGAGAGLPATGHQSMFLNHGVYFMNGTGGPVGRYGTGSNIGGAPSFPTR